MKNVQGEIRRIMEEKAVTYYALAKATGIDRGSLHKSLKDGSNLELNTLTKVLGHLGYEIQIIESVGKEVTSYKIRPRRSTRRKGNP